MSCHDLPLFFPLEKEKEALMKRKGCYLSVPAVQIITIKTLAVQSAPTFLSFFSFFLVNHIFPSAHH